jgi:flagellar biosynthesis protein FlhF
MQLKRYSGNELPEVMRRIRDELGPDAVILHTRHARPRGLLRLRSGPAVEVVAAIDPAPGGPGSSAGEAGGSQPLPGGADGLASGSDRSPAARREWGRSAGRKALSPRGTVGTAGGLRGPATVEEQIAELRDLVVRLGGIRLLTPDLVGLWERMVASGVDESLTHAVLRSLPLTDGDGRPLPAEALARALEARLVQMVPLAPPPPEGGHVTALVGPPASGKTTTLAKIAARHRIAGREVEIASAADGPLGAPSPLETFAPMIGAGFTFVEEPGDLTPLLARAAAGAVVLLDTPGVSAGDATGDSRLGPLLAAAAPGQVHLVLPATAKAADAQAAIRTFASLGVTDLVWTHLDETTTHGTVLGVSLEAGCPLSCFGTGPDVPGDLEPASAEALVRRVLPAEVMA